ncbi:MAG: hypothetical protein LH471_10745 [Salinibacterium sp.]|nr:hypothetical protein [Salinibacterium sp.]
MILRLDPRLPVVWRSPMSVQIGVDPPRVRLDDVSPTTERLISALVAGVTRPGLTMCAGRESVECDALLEAVAPVLLGAPNAAEQAGAPRPIPTIVVAGSGVTADALIAAFANRGSRVLTLSDPAEAATTIGQTGTEFPDAAVIVGHFVLPPTAGGPWLRRDVPHLPVVFSESGVQVGPLVTPGTGPCLHCLELHHRDADAAWPALASQLFGRRSAADAAPLALEAAAQACRMVLAAVSPAAESSATGSPAAERGLPQSLNIRAESGEREWRDWAPHAECDCRGIRLLANSGATRGQRGIDWAAEQLRGPARHWPTRRVQASAEPA